MGVVTSALTVAHAYITGNNSLIADMLETIPLPITQSMSKAARLRMRREPLFITHK